jgi:hypothetical protein
VRPEHRLHAAPRLGHIASVTLVADSQLDPPAHLGVEAVGVAHQQPGTDTGLAQQPHDVRSDVAGRGVDSDRHGNLLSLRMRTSNEAIPGLQAPHQMMCC